MNLKGKKILVTGSSSGIGRAIAIVSAQKGAFVFVHYRKNKSGAEETLKEVERHSAGKIIQADLTDLSQVQRIFQEIKDVDLLVNNAGDANSGSFDSYEMWKDQWENIFLSQVYTSNEFLKLDSESNLRKIVNISSIYGIPEMGNPEFPQYSAAKAAVNSFTLNLAKHVTSNILVNAVAPGFTWTPAWEDVPQNKLKAYEELTKIKRFIQPEEIANVVVSLLENDSITGEIVRVDGGLHLLDRG